MDPRNPDVLYASSYQRRRHVWTLINGGPESAIYKTTDGGGNWDKLKGGLPTGYVGRIGIAISPVNPDVIYAIIEASEKKGGFFRTTDRGATWEKRNSIATRSAQYYQELFCDPKDVGLVYSVDTYTQYTTDGGKTFTKLKLKQRHVDDHAMWINPENTDNIMIGGDGGVYQTYDRGETWRFFENLPVTQFYRVTADNAEPFYNVYGGTQDNNTLGAPVRTTNSTGIMNQDWYFTVGGDGFKTMIDPTDPNIVYSQPQYGWLVRHDKRSGEITPIQPQPGEGELLRWNWNSPLIISPHSHTRLYFAANKLFKSDDRGNSWTAISGDLTRQIDRNKLKVMGKIWEPEAVAKNASTSLYGNIVSLSESAKKQGLIFVGTDDGLIRVTENDGGQWINYEEFPGIPENTYVADLKASLHDKNVVYASFDNRKQGDFKPYILRSTDKGKSWKSISGNLPENGTVHTIAEDHESPNLLFAGTEFGLFFTLDGGRKWIQLKNGLPVISVRDIDVQRRENDLALATLGRGIYILDDYSPLRSVSKEMLDKEAVVFPVKDALIFTKKRTTGRHSMGHTFYRAENHPYGAVITYYLKEAMKTKKAIRKDSSKKLTEAGKGPLYPNFAQLRAEDEEEPPFLMFRITDAGGNTVRWLKQPAKKGINRIVWDLREASTSPLGEKSKANKHSGMPVLPGEYQVEMYKNIDGALVKIAGPVRFNARNLDNVTLPAVDVQSLADFRNKVSGLRRAVYGAAKTLGEARKKLTAIRKTLMVTPEANPEIHKMARELEYALNDIGLKLSGDKSKSKRNANQSPSITSRLGLIIYGISNSRSQPTKTNLDGYNIVDKQFRAVSSDLKELVENNLKALERKLDEINAPWTPGRIIEVKK